MRLRRKSRSANGIEGHAAVAVLGGSAVAFSRSDFADCSWSSAMLSSSAWVCTSRIFPAIERNSPAQLRWSFIFHSWPDMYYLLTQTLPDRGEMRAARQL